MEKEKARKRTLRARVGSEVVPLAQAMRAAADMMLKNPARRKALQFGAIGVGAFIVGKYFGPLASLVLGPDAFSKETLFKNFRVVENGEELQFYSRDSNKAIFILEK